MENVPWDGTKYTKVSGTKRNDPLLQHKESPYALEHVVSKDTTVLGSPPKLGPAVDPNMFGTQPWFNGNQGQKSRNKAISKIEDELTLFENLFETLYERREAYAMLIGAGRELLRFVTNWRNPRYYKSLGKSVKTPSNLPQAWLYYNFGVKPLIGSIDSACNLLGGEIPPYMVRMGSGYRYSDTNNNLGPYSQILRRIEGDCYTQFRVWIEPNINPNAGLLNVVGLTTPFSTAMSVIPWGWAVDYFVNLSDQLANYENRFPGVTIRDVYETRVIKGKCSSMWRNWVANPEFFVKNEGEFVHMLRTRSNLQKGLTFSFPLIGDNKAANLFSAIAMTLKGSRR